MESYFLSDSNTESMPEPADISYFYATTLKRFNPPLPPHLAAVSALTTALTKSTTQLPTLAETLTLLTTLTAELKASLPPATALAISAGTDAFQRQLVTALPGPNGHSAKDAAGGKDAEATTRATIKQASQAFIDHHIALRSRIPRYGRRFIRPGTTVLVPSRASRLVDEFLIDAAERDVPFRVIFLSPAPFPQPTSSSSKNDNSGPRSRPSPATLDVATSNTIPTLHAKGIPTTTTSASCLARILNPSSNTLTPTSESRRLFPPQQTLVLTGAAALLASGGILADAEAGVAAWVANGCGREVWVVAETGKCVKGAGVGNFASGGGGGLVWEGGDVGGEDDGWQDVWTEPTSTEEGQDGKGKREEETLDVIPASLLTGFITEEGPRSGAAVVEEAVKLWL